ncbi:ABC transporter ATP-binding protein [Candidatus Dojkabacteria bacterium]|uniref:ABC transporter ATP-binding protein n=1 Tax=Candidatus Dojkabacteria bacterium TaxID=2099670 RepID=A0A955I8W8_9BACT|nr:ABC transporter ATP-binding protein [Candidatus Dojkabacteria bacterium]
MNYELTEENQKKTKLKLNKVLGLLYRQIKEHMGQMGVAFIYLLINSATVIIAPFIIGDVTNKYIPTADKSNLLKFVAVLAIIYILGSLFSYLQIRLMGSVGQKVIFNIRNSIFTKLQALPLQFFNQNKSGELISRINNDTEKMSQAFSETLLRFTGDIIVIAGIGIAMLILNLELGLIAIFTLLLMVSGTWFISGWIKERNENSLQKLGELSGEIQESLANFKVSVVFNRRDYFRDSFAKVNENNRVAATGATIANTILAPIYTMAGNFASGVILIFGIQILLIDKIQMGAAPEFGTLLTFILYSSSFFNPLKEMGELFSQLQVAIASWSRIYRLLDLRNNMEVIESAEELQDNLLMKFDNVSFGYDPEQLILHEVNLDLDAGKTYALVGPTGGGKSTTASLMVRLYDATEGRIFFKGRDVRSFKPDDLSSRIGFILQEPFLFSGTISENIKYGNSEIVNKSDEEIEDLLASMGLEGLVNRFQDGLQTKINPGAENISLGQRQLISFIRVILRQPDLLILDEATANVDTVTEQLLEEILNKLPKSTTKVVIAHRLNTIENADQIFFISGGRVEKPRDFSSTMDLINNSQGRS